ncbi:metallo-beta-lactamase domain protein, partial [Teladorsagia circumcincta]
GDRHPLTENVHLMRSFGHSSDDVAVVVNDEKTMGRVIVAALEKHDLVPPNVDIVVTTHGHPDHAGGVHDFPDAVHYQGWYIHHHTTFNLSSLFEGDRHPLTENVHLMRSVGHSSDDVAVVVNDEKTMGRVIVAGDTFMRREDLDYPMMWKPLSANETEQARSRRNLICEAAWIIPGHGAPFPVTRHMRVQFRC